MLAKLKLFLKEQKIDFFLLPNSDQFFSEYLPESEKRIQYLTGFNGSNALVIFGQEKSYFFTDGRYILQAKNQLDLNEFEVFNMAEKPVLSWIADNLTAEKKLAVDAKLQSVNFIKSCQKNSLNLLFLEQNPVDAIWKNRANPANSQIFSLSQEVCGFNFQAKRKQILQGLKADAMIITKPENVCWLLNIRAADVEFTPLLLAQAILFKNGDVDLFVAEQRAQNLVDADLVKVNFIDPEKFQSRILSLKESCAKIQIDESSTNYWLYQLLQKNNFEIINKVDPIEIAKACKNHAEISGAIKAHQADGFALTEFLFWIEKSLAENQEIDEISAAEKLLELRKKNSHFLYPSFAAISGFAANGAVIHYHADEKTNKKISANSLYLIDSGAQYFGTDFIATTDVTRTIAIGKPSAEMIENFTRVLKGHIALARAKFPLGTTGAQLDVLARNHLWQAGLNYDHGTGHGVGSFLSVHEGPCGISKRSHQELMEGMIISNEPGFYKDGGYGIRIENLMLVEKHNQDFLQFRTLTLAPIDASLIDFKMLTYPEKKWLKKYHQNLLEIFTPNLEKEQKIWLENLTQKFTNQLGSDY
ncbi:MAG: aminopeptidase P family protein [Proteobacteria bacterium]|nr:aminopeptidase P family protein [Pseudomonadota bacterium]